MEIETFYLRHWYYFVPLYVLSALMWTLVGRFFLQFFFADPNSNYIMRFFVRFTDPLYRLFAPLTPAFLHPVLLPLYYAYFLVMLRLLFHVAMASSGLAPTLEGVAEAVQG